MEHDVESRGTQRGGHESGALRPALRLDLAGKPDLPDLFADRLLAAINAKKSCVCVGIDPMLEMLPDVVAESARTRFANDARAAVDAIFEFTTGVLKTVAPHAACVKFQSAYFERYR